MLQSFGGDFWGVYIGGPTSAASGWTPGLIGEYVAVGIGAFLPIYAGRQAGGPLTADQGARDAEEAIRLMQRFGWGAGALCTLDVEAGTSASNLAGAVAYADGWCAVMRRPGYVPGVYGTTSFLTRLSSETNRPSFAFPARWITEGFDPSVNPDHISGLPDSAYPGMRVWQYGGGDGAQVLGLNVDFNAANFQMTPPPHGAITGTSRPAPVLGRDYTVKAGDTLGAIAARFSVTVAALVAANPQILNPNLIGVGQMIRVPGNG
jgi:hypothetical protein